MKQTVLLFALTAVVTVQAKNPGGDVSPAITGGEEAAPNAYPFLVALYIKFGKLERFCGGTILNDEYILTAAHCVASATEAQALYGTHNVDEDEPSQRFDTSTEFITYKDYNPTTLDNDIALIKMPSKIPFSDAIKPVVLPCTSADSWDLTDKMVTICGWGRYSDETSDASSVVRFVTTKVLSSSDCEDMIEVPITSKHLCLSGEQGKSACKGDSGGPALYDGVQFGVFSFFSSSGCERGMPHVFTRITSFLPWIQEHTGIQMCT